MAAVAARFDSVHANNWWGGVFRFGKRWLFRVPKEVARGMWRYSSVTSESYGKGAISQFLDISRLYLTQGIGVQDYYSGGLAGLARSEQRQLVPFWMYRDAVLFCMKADPMDEVVRRINSKSWLSEQVRMAGFMAPKTMAMFDPAIDALDKDEQAFNCSFFVKPDQGSKGDHAERWLLQDDVFVLPDESLTISRREMSNHLRRKSHDLGRTLLVQELMQNSQAMRTWAGDTLATARIDTCRTPNGEVTVGRAMLRMPANQTSSVDNLANGGKGFHVDPVSGTIGMGNSLQGLGRADYSKLSPATGREIEGRIVPGWAEMVAMVKSLHTELSELPIIGWDVGHTPDGPAVVEANVPTGIGITVQVKMGGFFPSTLGSCLAQCIANRLKETQPEGSRLLVGADLAMSR